MGWHGTFWGDAQVTAGRLLDRATAMFTEPTANYSLHSLASAFMIAAVFLWFRRGWTRPVRGRALLRALLPKRWLRSPSVRADVGLLFFNNLVAAVLIGWAFVSAGFFHGAVDRLLDPLLGDKALVTVSRPALAAIMTVAVYFTYELAYFVDHYLKHNVPLLWHFHRVHHSAETLTPLTNARMHPVDAVIFANITALALGTAGSVVDHVFAAPGDAALLWNANIVLLAALFLILHLQHSEVWIPFTGTLGKLLLSPAHHQLHHSTNPAHFNRNLGATCALFDYLAGTLLVPTRDRERLRFGAGPYDYDPHSVTGTLVRPFVDAAAELKGGAVVPDAAVPLRR